MASRILNIDYKIPYKGIQAVKPKSMAAVRVGDIRDLRQKDPRHLMDKLKMSGAPASGAYILDRPLSDLVGQALTRAFSEFSDRDENADPDLILSADIQSVDFAVMVGFAGCLLKGSISLAVRLDRPDDGGLVWKGVVNGAGRSGKGELTSVVFSAALDDAVISLFQNPALSM